MDLYEQMAEKIIEHQESIIGPIAIERAEDVTGIKIDWSQKSVKVESSNPSNVIDNLVGAYESLFGQTSVEVCKEAVGRLLAEIPKEQQPASLR